MNIKQRPKMSAHIATSIDGYIAKKDDELDWLSDIQHLINKLYAESIRHIYVDGGKTISQFLNKGLIDELIISLIPVILGSGIPLFNNVMHESWCDLISSQSYSMAWYNCDTR